MALSVTTIIVTYNHARFIEQTVRSVQEQEVYDRHRIVIIDDCSLDGTRDVVTQLGAEDDRIRLIMLPHNECSNRALAVEIERATTACIAVLDGDDYWTHRDKLKIQLDWFERHPTCMVSFHNALVVDEDGVPLRPFLGNSSPPTSTLADILQRDFVPTCTAVIRADACRPLPGWYVTAPLGDWPLWVLSARRGELHYLDRTMAARREHSGGLWSGASRLDQLQWEIQLLQSFGTCVDGEPALSVVERRVWQRLYDLAVEHERLGDLASAARLLRRCLDWRPPDALEQHFAGHGLSPRQGWRLLRRKHWLYCNPWLYAVCCRLPWFQDEGLPEVMDPPL